MNIQVHSTDNTAIAEISSADIILQNEEDVSDILGNLYFQGVDKIIISEKNITPDFFDLKNGIAGAILQKFSTYRVRLAVVGEFSKYKSNSLNDFIYESNKGRHINFVRSIAEAISILSSQ